MKISDRIIAIVGPTASGKSDAAIALARLLDGEIISVDSRQVYRGMDVGTGKVNHDDAQITNYKLQITNENQNTESTKQKTQKPNEDEFYSEGIRHHLIDVAGPNEEYNISHFLHDAEAALADIRSRGKFPLLCGGTHFWAQALLEEQTLPEVPPNPVLRAELETKSPAELFQMLEEKDSARAATIDRNNKVRLVRALEIVESLGKVPEAVSSQQSTVNKEKNLIIAINPKKEILRERIQARLEKRFHEGMIEEVETLHANGVSWERLETFGLEYRYIALFLQGKISDAEMRERLFFEIWHYAKRQLSWLRRWEKQGSRIHWFENQTEIVEFFKKTLPSH